MEIMLHLITRRNAKEHGLRMFFTGRPCCHGHVCERYTGNKNCLMCKRERDNKANALPASKEKRSEYDRKRWIHDKDRLEAKNKANYAKNKDAINAQKREYYIANREKLRADQKLWRADNAPLIRCLNKMRLKRSLQAMPLWVDKSAIKLVYLEAQRLTIETGVQYHVDHIVPLKGKLVSGLHVPWNLRAIPWHENLSKTNNLDDRLAIAS